MFRLTGVQTFTAINLNNPVYRLALDNENNTIYFFPSGHGNEFSNLIGS